MASLTPGVLSKLLQNVGNNKVNVTGKHRFPLLQVIEIVPSFAGGGDDALLRSSGFYVKVSDSLHSTYLLISDEDVDLIYSDKIQLGQFVYVSGLEKGSPVPIVRGIKPLPRRYPCVGNPKDFVSTDLFHIGKSFNFSQARSSKKTVVSASVKKGSGDKAKWLGYDEGKLRRVSLGEDGRKAVGGLEMRRLSLDSTRRVWDQCQTPKATIGSRFVSSGSRLKESPSSPMNVKAVIDNKDYPRKDLLLKCHVTKKTPKTKIEAITLDLNSRPLKKDQVKSSSRSTISSTSNHTKLEPNSRTRFKNISLSLPPIAHELRKGTLSRKNAAFVAAVNSLEEASASEGAIRCMSMFAELCESSQNDSVDSVVESFLKLYQIMRKTANVIDSLMNTTPHEAIKCMADRDATLWVQAAVESNLSKFSLFKTQDKKEIVKDEKCHYVIYENTSDKAISTNASPQNRKISRLHHKGLSPRNPSPSKKKSIKGSTWSKGSGLKAASNLATELLLVSRGWFLKYLEDSLDKGFGLRGQACKVENAMFLGKLKRVNEWLGESTGNHNEVDERIELLKKKLYGFLLENTCFTAAVRK